MNQPLETRRTFLKTALKQTLATGLFASLPLSALRAADREAVKKPQYSCASVNFTSLSLEQACERIAALRFDAIDIWGTPWAKHMQEIAEDLKAEGFKALLEKHQLKLGSFAVYGTGYAPYAELLGQCGGGTVLRTSRHFREGVSLTEDMKSFLEELKPELELCEKYDSYLAIQNHSGAQVLDRTDTIKAFVDLNQHKRLGIALGPYHLMRHGESVADAIRICGDQLMYIYFWTNEEGEKQMPGIGQTDMSDWFRALNDIKYPHYLTPFMHHEPEPDRMSELHRLSRQYLDKTFEAAIIQS